MATKKIEPLEIVRNIVTELDKEIYSTEATIKFIEKERDSEMNQAILLEYKSFLYTLQKLREFTIYKS